MIIVVEKVTITVVESDAYGGKSKFMWNLASQNIMFNKGWAKTACMVGLMWPKLTGAKGNSVDVQNKCACGRRWNSRAARFAGSRYVRARLAAQFGYCGNKMQEQIWSF
jgi:hypothetical protein